MTTQAMHRARARRLVVITLVLVLVGAGAAAAYWTATTQLSATGSSAHIGLEQALLPSESDSPLAVTYTSETESAAGTIALTNTGSRTAAYTLTVEATSTGAETLPTALQLAAGPLADGQDCTPASTAGTTGTGAQPLTIAGELEAGATIDLCLRTALAVEDGATPPDAEITLAVFSSLRYADGDAWTVEAGPSTITQAVGPREPGGPGEPEQPGGPSEPTDPEAPDTPGTSGLLSDGARRTLRLEGACIQRTSMDGGYGIALQTACGPWEAQWRLTEMGDGTFTIDWARNETPGTRTQPRWTATGAGGKVMLAAPHDDDAAQKWRLSTAGPGQYRFESVAHPGQVVTVGEGLWNPHDRTVRRLTLEVADAPPEQSFEVAQVGTPYPELEQMVPDRDGPWDVGLAFTRNDGGQPGGPEGYDLEVAYRVLLAPEDAPESRVAHPSGGLLGGYTTMRFTPDSLKEYAASAQGGAGNTWVHVEQKLPGGDWAPVAVGKIHIAAASGNTPAGVYPGWR